MKKIITSLLALLVTSVGFAQSSSPLHVAVKGKGPKHVLLIPGFTCSGSVWDATVQELSAIYTCHVITFPGFAGQPAQADPHLGDWVTNVATYIRQQHLEKPIVIGHSIGGGMAMMLAARNPELVSKIVVVDALPCLGLIQNPSFKADPSADCSPIVNRYTSMTDSVLYATQKRSIPMLCVDTAMQATILNWSIKSDRKTMGQIYCEFVNTDLRETIAGISCPALIMLEPSFKLYDAVMQQQYARLQHKQIVYANKGLHFIMYDDKDWYLQQLTTYLQ